MIPLTNDVKLKGHIWLILVDEKMRLKDYREVDNVVVSVGKNYVAAWLAAASQAGTFMQYLAVGTGTNAAAITDTTLQTELPTRVAGTVTSSTNIWQNQATFNVGVDTGAITEAGIFSASSGGTLLARQVFAVVNKSVGDSLQITWQLSIS
jgi:hypothetical protein